MNNKIYPHTVDSHTHLLEMEKKGIDTHSLLTECFNNGMKAALDAGVCEKDFDKRMEFKETFPFLYFTAGVHPSETRDIKKQLKIIDKQLENKNIIGVGETGLDFHWDTVPSKIQKEMF
ncbi:MAG: hypothetical protein GY760_07345, partial [Deltaproteobacteria bacterium]|nr:hypothetical protein [Deltaproteobacteria bacterium]